MSETSDAGLTGETIRMIVGGSVTIFLIGIILLIRRVRKKVLSWSNLLEGCLGPKEAEQNREIYTELVGLRAVADADRAYVFRFHNGMEFLPSHPAWKLSCTHEVVKHGVTYESAKLQGVLVSLIPNIVNPVLTGSSSMTGITVPECPECPFQQKCLRENKRVVVILVDEMENSFCKFHLEGQNVKTVIMCGIAFGGNVFGLVGVDFCGMALPPDRVREVSQRVCRATDRIQFLLQFKKSSVDLPIPDRPFVN